MKLLIAGDLHYRGTNPRARTDLFPEALTSKLYEVFDIARQRKAGAIVIPGDIFDSPAVAYSVFGDLAHVLKVAPCPILTVPGNHDLWGHNAESQPRTAYGVLARLEIVWDLTGECMENMKEDICIVGRGYTADTDTNLDGYLVSKEARDAEGYNVWVSVAHGMALPQAPGYDLRHTLLEDIAAHEDAPDILIVGHEHIGFGVKAYARKAGGEMLAVNPGALCRLTAHPAEIARQVQVCLLEIHGRHKDGLLMVDVEMIPLKTARPGCEVLSRAHLEAQAEREERMNRFLALLVEEGEAKYLEVRDIVEDLGRRDNLPRDVVDEALRRIAVAREALGAKPV